MKESSHPAWNGIVNRGGSGPHDAPRILSFPLISDAHISFPPYHRFPDLSPTPQHISPLKYSFPPFPPFLRLRIAPTFSFQSSLSSSEFSLLSLFVFVILKF